MISIWYQYDINMISIWYQYDINMTSFGTIFPLLSMSGRRVRDEIAAAVSVRRSCAMRFDAPRHGKVVVEQSGFVHVGKHQLFKSSTPFLEWPGFIWSSFTVFKLCTTPLSCLGKVMVVLVRFGDWSISRITWHIKSRKRFLCLKTEKFRCRFLGAVQKGWSWVDRPAVAYTSVTGVGTHRTSEFSPLTDVWFCFFVFSFFSALLTRIYKLQQSPACHKSICSKGQQWNLNETDVEVWTSSRAAVDSCVNPVLATCFNCWKSVASQHHATAFLQSDSCSHTISSPWVNRF